MNVSLRDQVKAMVTNTRDNALVEKYPYVRRDGGVRAKILDACVDGDSMLIATVDPSRKAPKPRYGADTPRAYDVGHEATLRVVTTAYFDNNYWEGKN